MTTNARGYSDLKNRAPSLRRAHVIFKNTTLSPPFEHYVFYRSPTAHTFSDSASPLSRPSRHSNAITERFASVTPVAASEDYHRDRRAYCGCSRREGHVASCLSAQHLAPVRPAAAPARTRLLQRFVVEGRTRYKALSKSRPGEDNALQL